LGEQLHEERIHGAGRLTGADRAEDDDVLRGVGDRQGDLTLRRDAGGMAVLGEGAGRRSQPQRKGP
jgi:hypothetical protein